jgi:hypothetical protein
MHPIVGYAFPTDIELALFSIHLEKVTLVVAMNKNRGQSKVPDLSARVSRQVE